VKSNALPRLVTDTPRKKLIEQCQADGLIDLKTTHLQLSELSRIPEERDIGQADAIDVGKIGPGVFVLGYSRLSEDRLSDAKTNADFTALQKGNVKNTEDATIGVTAILVTDILVTNDVTLRKRIEALKTRFRVMTAAEFAAVCQASKNQIVALFNAREHPYRV
jgi:hypothetical protein